VFVVVWVRNCAHQTFCWPNEVHFTILTFLSLLSSMDISTWRSSMRSAGPRDLYSPLWNRTCLDPPKPCLFVPLRKFLGSVGLRILHFSYPYQPKGTTFGLGVSWNHLHAGGFSENTGRELSFQLLAGPPLLRKLSRNSLGTNGESGLVNLVGRHTAGDPVPLALVGARLPPFHRFGFQPVRQIGNRMGVLLIFGFSEVTERCSGRSQPGQGSAGGST